MRQLVASLLLFVWTAPGPQPPRDVTPGARPDSVAFAVIGDTGTGDKPEYEVAQQMVEVRAKVPYEMVIMLGDNMYGRQQPKDFADKFERPYALLLQAGVKFYATLGNHDNPANRFYEGFNMGGQRYFTYQKKNVRFFVLDSNLMDPKQLAWIDESLKQSQDDWRICYFHHPLYSDAGRHGPTVDLRVVLEPLLVKYGVNVVFSGHDHVYERLKPQKGVLYFIEGSSGQLARGDVNPSRDTAAYFDQDRAFLVVIIAGDDLLFEAISRTGRTVDSGVVHRRPRT